MHIPNYEIDDMDRMLIAAIRRNGRVTNAELARIAGLARGTVQSRIDRLKEQRVIVGWGPDLDPRSTDRAVVAFVTLSIAQGAHERVVAALEQIHDVLEVHVVTGDGDLLCRVAAQSNDHLHELIQRIVAVEGVLRSDTQIALHTPIARTLADLILSTD